jgi:RNA polymerase sigma-70 factor (ECF subfamily)
MSCLESKIPDDASLLRQMENGSKQAFSLLFGKYWGDAYSAAYKRIKEEETAKDIVQDIFAHIWINRETLHIDNLPAYLHTAVRNKVIKHLGRRKLTHPFFKLIDHLPEKHLQADSRLLWKEFFDSYEALLSSLPPQRQLIFRLRYQESLPTKSISRKLGISRKTVQNQLGKALQTLKVSLLRMLILVLIFPTLY